MEERIRFANADGLILAGVYTPPPAPTGRAVVLCHGLSYDKDEGGIFAALAARLAAAGLAAFRFDFRGHGESEGDPVAMTVAGEVRDLEAAIAHLKTRGHGRFGLVGASFGAAPVALYAARNTEDVGCLVIWNGLIDYADWRSNRTAGGTQRWSPEALARLEREGVLEVFSDPPFLIGAGLVAEVNALEPWKELLPLTLPMLFLHGDHDRVVRHDLTTRCVPQLKAAELVTITGAEHGFRSAPEHTEKAVATATEFLRTTL